MGPSTRLRSGLSTSSGRAGWAHSTAVMGPTMPLATAPVRRTSSQKAVALNFSRSTSRPPFHTTNCRAPMPELWNMATGA